MAEFDPVRDDYTLPEEFPAPGPEFTPVGMRTQGPAGEEAKRKKRKRLIYGIAAAALVLALLGPFRLFSGSGDAAPSAPGTAQAGQSGPGMPQPGAPGGVQTPQPSAAPTAAPDATPSAAPVYHVPDCEIFITSFYSEFRGKLLFHEMDDAEAVTLQYWDPETESCDAEYDITKEALEDGEYNIGAFYSDFIYEKHQEYYDEQNAFPMKLRVTVLVDYTGPDGHALAEFSADSMEASGWIAEYIPADVETWTEWLCPGCFQVQVKDCPVAYQIIYGRDMPESENYLFVTMEIDGEPIRIDPATLTTLHDEYDAYLYVPGEEELVSKHFHTTLLVIPMPEGYAEGEGHTATFTVRQYLAEPETAVAFVQDVEF